MVNWNVCRKEMEWGGRKLVLETGKIAKQATGAVYASYGDTVVVATVVAAKEAKADQDFFPLTVNYQEKYYATGKIPGGFMKREGKPSEHEVLVSRPNDEPQARSLHGLTRTNIANMVNGVVNGYEKKLEIVGVGMRCQKQGSNLVMNLGFSHQVNIPDTEDCTIVWQDPNHFSVTGIDKQKVGQYAAEIRGKKPPEPYKGKGIRYAGEVVKHKEGKAGKGKK